MGIPSKCHKDIGKHQKTNEREWANEFS